MLSVHSGKFPWSTVRVSNVMCNAALCMSLKFGHAGKQTKMRHQAGQMQKCVTWWNSNYLWFLLSSCKNVTWSQSFLGSKEVARIGFSFEVKTKTIITWCSHWVHLIETLDTLVLWRLYKFYLTAADIGWDSTLCVLVHIAPSPWDRVETWYINTQVLTPHTSHHPSN